MIPKIVKKYCIHGSLVSGLTFNFIREVIYLTL